MSSVQMVANPLPHDAESTQTSKESCSPRPAIRVLSRLPSILAPSKHVASSAATSDVAGRDGGRTGGKNGDSLPLVPRPSVGCCRFWCATQGCIGVVSVAIWLVLLTYTTILFSFHCTDILSEMVDEDEVRTEYLAISLPVQVGTGLLCAAFTIYTIVGLITATCAWTPMIARKAFKRRPTSRFRLLRAYWWCRCVGVGACALAC